MQTCPVHAQLLCHPASTRAGCSAESGRHAEKVKSSAALAASIGISGTPSFVVGRTKGDMVDGVKIVGAQPFAMFDQKLKELSKGQK